MRSPEARLAVSLLGIVVSFAMMWTALAMTQLPPERRSDAAVWAIIPWNGLLLSQLGYVGYFFIPLEVLASALLLRRRALLSRSAAFLAATLVRVAAFIVVSAAAAAARQWHLR